ncbi:CRISPR-associated protein Csx16 [Azotobacter vinelandii]|uniref:CRISPR-associated protein Csx16 n=1 Tax=Azotobacter vinelandii TaxID=354 RepID=UPI002666C88E|nr:CRISPR-associated protein Csx16 [Azotobacter vinelandii]WKN24002.1 CRISPR-associated protein Csx16 [Azotobacter vinelandii]
MTTWFVSRHPGAHEWLQSQGVRVDRRVEHLDTSLVEPGDTVCGSLPVHLVAQLCAQGARYIHLIVDLPPQARGRELTAEEMRAYGARLVCFDVREVPCHSG